MNAVRWSSVFWFAMSAIAFAYYCCTDLGISFPNTFSDDSSTLLAKSPNLTDGLQECQAKLKTLQRDHEQCREKSKDCEMKIDQCHEQCKKDINKVVNYFANDGRSRL